MNQTMASVENRFQEAETVSRRDSVIQISNGYYGAPFDKE